MERLVFRTVAPAETRDWYVKTFGAGSESLPTGARPQIYIAQLPGVSMYFVKADAAGQKFDRPYGLVPNSATAMAFLTDPWGTYIELTENLAPPK